MYVFPRILLTNSLPFAILLGFLGCRGGRIEEYQVVSSSMAPTLVGPTLPAVCTQCGATRDVAAETFRSEYVTRCYRCGYTCRVENRPTSGQIARLSPLDDTAKLKRFDVVALKTAEGITAKRIWGLPGESLMIRNGKLWIHQQPYRRSLADFERTSIPLADFSQVPSPMWKIGSVSGDDERPLAAGVEPVAVGASESLIWRYQKPASVRPHEVPNHQWLTASGLDDDYPCNQGLSYLLKPIDDFLISLEFSQPMSGTAHLNFPYRRRDVKIELLSAEIPSSQDAGAQVSIPVQVKLKLAICDGRLLVQSDRREFTAEWAEVESSFPESATSEMYLQITPQSTSLQITECRISRDIYLRVAEAGATAVAGQPPAEEKSWPPAADSFFVIGDNVPASIDSRNGLGMVSRGQIVGRIEP